MLWIAIRLPAPSAKYDVSINEVESLEHLIWSSRETFRNRNGKGEILIITMITSVSIIGSHLLNNHYV